MRVHSTTESAATGEVTLLAILETGVAVGISIWLAWHRHSLRHIKIGACLAPLLLLRTERSTELALRWLYGFIGWAVAAVNRLDGWRENAGWMAFGFMGAPLGLAVIEPRRSPRSRFDTLSPVFRSYLPTGSSLESHSIPCTKSST